MMAEVPDEDHLLVQARDLSAQVDPLLAEFLLRASGNFRPKESPAWNTAMRIKSERGPDGPWSIDFVDRINTRVCIYLLICTQHFAAINILLTHGPFGLSLGPLTRSIVEACGRAVWLIDPAFCLDDVRSRVARLLLDEEEDTSRFKSMAAKLQHERAPALGDEYRKARDLIKKDGVFRADESTSDSSGKVTLHGQTLPGLSEFVRLAERSLHDDREVADVTYSYLSSMTHPSVRAYAETLKPVTGADGAAAGVEPREDVLFTAKLVLHALSAFTDAWRAWATWTGAGTDEADRLVDQMNALHGSISTAEAARQSGSIEA